MSVTTLRKELSIAQELAIQGQLNGRLYGVLQSLLSDLNDHSDWDHFSVKLKNDCLHLEKYGAMPAAIGEDATDNAKRLSLVRQINKKLCAALGKLSDAIDTYSDPGFYRSWNEATRLAYGTMQNPVSAVVALRYA